MNDKRINFKARPDLLSGTVYWYDSQVANLTVCADELRKFFKIDGEQERLTLVFSERAHKDAYPFTFYEGRGACASYHVPVLGGHILSMLWPAESRMHTLWDQGYNYMRLEL